MADSKITGLTADTAPSTDDLVTTINDPGGTPANRKVTVANFMTQANMKNPYKFSVSRAAAATTGNGAFAKVVWDTEAFDTNSNFATGTYTAPVAGFYQFNACINPIAGTVNIISLFKNGAEFRRGGQIVTAGGISVGVLVQLAASDTVDIYAYGNAANTIDVTAGLNYFTGHLVSIT